MDIPTAREYIKQREYIDEAVDKAINLYYLRLVELEERIEKLENKKEVDPIMLFGMLKGYEERIDALENAGMLRTAGIEMKGHHCCECGSGNWYWYDLEHNKYYCSPCMEVYSPHIVREPTKTIELTEEEKTRIEYLAQYILEKLNGK
jgi:hypothetical protein